MAIGLFFGYIVEAIYQRRFLPPSFFFIFKAGSPGGRGFWKKTKTKKKKFYPEIFFLESISEASTKSLVYCVLEERGLSG